MSSLRHEDTPEPKVKLFGRFGNLKRFQTIQALASIELFEAVLFGREKVPVNLSPPQTGTFIYSTSLALRHAINLFFETF